MIIYEIKAVLSYLHKKQARELPFSENFSHYSACTFTMTVPTIQRGPIICDSLRTKIQCQNYCDDEKRVEYKLIS